MSVFDKYIIQEIIGSSKAGSIVLKGRSIDQSDCAIKIKKFRNGSDGLEAKLLEKRFIELNGLVHQNIVLFMDYYEQTSENEEFKENEILVSYSVYELMEYSLEKIIFQIKLENQKITEELVFGIFKDCLFGITFLVSQGISHGNLKPSNILFSNGLWKIMDSMNLNSDDLSNSYNANMKYLSPEKLRVMTGLAIPFSIDTTKSDLWTLAFIINKLFVNGIDGVSNEINQKYGWKNILKNSFQNDYLNRPSIEEIILFLDPFKDDIGKNILNSENDVLSVNGEVKSKIEKSEIGIGTETLYISKEIQVSSDFDLDEEFEQEKLEKIKISIENLESRKFSNIQRNLTELKEASKFLNRRKLNNSELNGRLLALMGILCFEVGLKKSAIENFNKSSMVFDELLKLDNNNSENQVKYLQKKAEILNYEGIIYSKMSNLLQAKELFHKSYFIYNTIYSEDHELVIAATLNFVEVLINLEEYESVVSILNKIIGLNLSNKEQMILVVLKLSEALEKSNKIIRAKDILLQYYRLQDLQNDLNSKNCEYFLILVKKILKFSDSMNDYEDCDKFCKSVIASIKENSFSNRIILSCLEFLILSNDKMDKKLDSLHYYEKVIEIKRLNPDISTKL